MDSNFWQRFTESPRDRERRELRKGWDEVETLWRRSPMGASDDSLAPLCTDLLTASWERHRQPLFSISLALDDVIDDLLRLEGICGITPLWSDVEGDVALAVHFRQMLTRRRRYVTDFSHVHGIVARQISVALDAVYAALPASCFRRDDAEGTFDVPLIELVEDPAHLIQELVTFPYAPPCLPLDLFRELRDAYRPNMCIASGLPPDTETLTGRQQFVYPTEQQGKTGTELADLYLAGTPFRPLLDTPVPFVVPDAVRFEHTHIVGGTGHGKTQLMQRMIHADLVAAQTERRSVVVIDSQGDLIGKLVRLELFNPTAEGSLADRLIVIDPTDVEFPCALNLFDAHLARVGSYSALDRERVQNGVVELYETFFGELLGAELTQKQGVIFRYLARLMLVIPGATIHTLMQLMEDGKPFRRYMDGLEGSARYFFAQEFFHPSFAATKKQILKRLWGVLSTPAFERMFAQPSNKLDLFDALNAGSIILINTAKDLLKDEGSQLFGRFFIALIKQAALERSTIPEAERTPAFVYVDEAQEYFDDRIETILTQGRKYRVAFTAAHQTLDQLSPRLRSAFHANTSFKVAGGVSAKDARQLADELHTTADFVQSVRRKGDRTEFAVWLKQLTPRAIRLSVPLGHLERQPTLTEEAYDDLIARNRARYCGTLAEVGQFSTGQSIEPEAGVDTAEEETPPFAGGAAEPIRVDIVSSEPIRSHPTERPRASKAPVLILLPSPDTYRVLAPVSKPRVEPEPIRRTTGPRRPEERGSGKGGPKHRYVQALVKELAEAHGFRAVIEAALPGGGQIDVLLSQGEVRVAVEVSVTTAAAWERENIRKCVAAGYSRVALVLAKSTKTQTRYRTAVLEGLSPAEQAAVTFLLPEDIPDYIAGLAPAPEPTTTTVKGYKVTVSRTSLSPEDAKRRRDQLARLVAKSLGQKPADNRAPV